MDLLRTMLAWPARRWWTAVGAGVATYLLIAIPTVLIPNPIFGREIPPTPWSYWAAAIAAVLSGLVMATYVATPDTNQRAGKLGMVGSFATFFAVGCPVCNKLVLLALGSTGAIQFFEPVQPYLAAGAIALLAWALVSRVRRENSCTLPGAAPSDMSSQGQFVR